MVITRIIYPKVMCINLAMDVTNVLPTCVSMPVRMFPITVAIINSFSSLFTTNHVGQDAEEVFANVCGATQIIDKALDVLLYCD